MEKIKISVYNLYKNNINYNMIGGAPAVIPPGGAPPGGVPFPPFPPGNFDEWLKLYKVNSELAEKIAKFMESQRSAKEREKLATDQFNVAKATEAARQLLATNQFNQAKATEAARQLLAIIQLTESQRSAKERELLAKAQLAENIEARKQRFELEKAKLDTENYTLDKCRNDVKEYMFYNLRNQIEMSKLMTKYNKNEYIIKNLLKDNNFDFAKVEKKLEGNKFKSDIGKFDEGKIVVQVPKLY